MMHDIDDCAACGGTGVIRTKVRDRTNPKVVAVISTCSCPTGRAVANTTAGYAVVQAVARVGGR